MMVGEKSKLEELTAATDGRRAHRVARFPGGQELAPTRMGRHVVEAEVSATRLAPPGRLHRRGGPFQSFELTVTNSVGAQRKPG